MSQFRRLLSLLLAAVLCFGLLPAAAFAADGAAGLGNFVKRNAWTDGIFSDVESDDWFYENVKSVYEYGLMVGKGENTFDPAGSVTLAETLTIAARLHSIYTTGAEAFEASDPWYAVYANYCLEEGICTTLPDDMNAAAPRAVFAVVLASAIPDEALEAKNVVADEAIPDVSLADSYGEAVYKLYRAGIVIGGDAEGTFDPFSNVKRSEVAAILTRMIDPSLRMSVTLGTVETAEKPVEEKPAEAPAAEKPAEEKKDTKPPFDWMAWSGWLNRLMGNDSRGSQNHNNQSDGFTVVFDGNAEDAENVPAPVFVAAGDLLVRPSSPTRPGYIFDNWYIDPECTTPYDYSQLVNSDIMLYAGWKEDVTTEPPDDVTDEYDSDVTKDDTYTLTASEMDVLAVSNAEVVFWVNTTLTTPYFELYCDGESTGVRLYDDGDYASHRDDIPNDGCYTGCLIFDSNYAEEKDYPFTATATIGTTEIYTNDVEIFVYYEITDDQEAIMEEIEDTVISLAEEAKNTNSTLSQDEIFDYIIEAVTPYLEECISKGWISSYALDNDFYIISWVYSDTGIENEYIVFYDDNSNIKESTNAAESFPSYTLSTGNSYAKGNVVILNIYANDPSWNDHYDAIGTQLSNAGFAVDTVYGFTCDSFKNLQKYNSMIILNSHGNTKNNKSSGIPCICTEQTQSKENNKHYSADLKKDRVYKITLSGGRKVYWIGPNLFRDYYKSEKMNDPIVYLGACRLYPQDPENTKMVKELDAAGANAIYGYSASVSVTYDHNMISALTDRLLYGDTADAALTAAKVSHGQQDSYFDNGKTWKKHAALNIYGNNTAKLYKQLANGSFDSLISPLLSWSKYGDARGIYKLSGLLPQSSPRMAIISSGFGSMNSETTSAIYQTLLVPGNAKTISFSYNVISEEPMEYVGSRFDDFFVADVLDTNGTLLNTFAYESVNTSVWHSITGIDFPGGDQTTFHTRWKTVTADISAYRGKLVVLRFAVKDAGDSIFDTAVVIDSVKITK